MTSTRDELLGLGEAEDAPEHVQLTSGRTVMVRGLSRNEALAAAKLVDRSEAEAYIIAACVVIEPALTVEDVAAWQARPGRAVDVRETYEAILRKSNMLGGSAVAVFKSNGERSVDGDGALPSGETIDDGGSAAAGDESG